MSTDMKKKLAQARSNVDSKCKLEWTQQINKELLPCNICQADERGELGDLINGLFSETRELHPNEAEVKGYIQDWILATGTYYMFEEGMVCCRPAYLEAAKYALSLDMKRERQDM
jgi:hypothetical protein